MNKNSFGFSAYFHFQGVTLRARKQGKEVQKMAFRRHITSHMVKVDGVSDALWKESNQATRRTLAIMKKGKTLARLTLADLDNPEKVLKK